MNKKNLNQNFKKWYELTRTWSTWLSWPTDQFGGLFLYSSGLSPRHYSTGTTQPSQLVDCVSKIPSKKPKSFVLAT